MIDETRTRRTLSLSRDEAEDLADLLSCEVHGQKRFGALIDCLRTSKLFEVETRDEEEDEEERSQSA